MGKILRLTCFFGWFFLSLNLAWGSDPDVPFKNVNDFGGVVSAVTQVGSSNNALLFTDIQTVHSGISVTFGPNTELHFMPGSGVSIATGATVYVYSPVVAGNYRIFYGNGVSYFYTGPMEGFFQDRWIGGTSSIGLGKQPGSSYVLDIGGSFRATNIQDSTFSSTKEATGAFYIANLTNSATLAGDTLYGGALSNLNALSEVTATVPTGLKGMNFSFDNSGTTPYVVSFNVSDTILGINNFVSGSSTIYLIGAAGSSYGSARCIADGKWMISGASVTTRNK